jgi:hypothetical protein
LLLFIVVGFVVVMVVVFVGTNSARYYYHGTSKHEGIKRINQFEESALKTNENQTLSAMVGF